MNTKQNQSATEHNKGEENIEAGHDEMDETMDESIDVTNESPVENASDSNDDKIKKLEAALAQEKDKLLRHFAEFENFKKRTIRERMELIKNAGEEIISTLLPVLDDFERAMKNTAGGDDAFNEGMNLIYQKLKTTLEQKGLAVMESVGKPFDTDLHEAITSVPGPENMSGMVVEEMEKGYFLNGKVLRHAKVVVGA